MQQSVQGTEGQSNRYQVSTELLECRDWVKLEPEDLMPFLTFLADNCQRRGERFECVRTTGCLPGPRHEVTGSY